MPAKPRTKLPSRPLAAGRRSLASPLDMLITELKELFHRNSYQRSRACRQARKIPFVHHHQKAGAPFAIATAYSGCPDSERDRLR